MTRLLVGTDGVETSQRLLEYLQETVRAEDEVHVINSQVGGDDTETDDLIAGEEALEVIADGLATGTVEHHQLVRGNEPVEDFLAAADDWDVDEYVIGIRKHSPVGKMVFGSTAQNILLETDRPVRCVPLVSD